MRRRVRMVGVVPGRAFVLAVLGAALLVGVSGGQAAGPPIVPPPLPPDCAVEQSARCLETKPDLASVSVAPQGIAVGDTATVTVTHVTRCPSGPTTEDELAGFPNQRCTSTVWGFGAGFVDNLKSGTVSAAPVGTCDGSTPSCSYQINDVTFPAAPGNIDPLPAWVTFPLELSVVRYDSSRTEGHRIVIDHVPVDAPVWVVRPATTGSIRIVAETVPASDSQGFGFNGLGDFSLDTDPSSSVPDQLRFDNVAVGEHVIREVVPHGWQLADIACSDQSGGTTVDVAVATATIDLAAGETVTCTFRNRKTAATGLVVNSTADTGEPDAEKGDGVCDTGSTITRNGIQESECTLRAAVIEANALLGPNTITFDIPSDERTITITSSLPVAGETTIDGTTQDDVRVRGEGSNAVVGIDLSGEDNALRGLAVLGFDIAVDVRGDGNTITRSTIDGDVGIRVSGAVTTIGGATIPGSCAEDCNILSGTRTAVQVANGATSTTISGNYVGLNNSALAFTPIPDNGVLVEAGSSATAIGGATASERNVIIAYHGVELHAPARVLGNYVGVGPEGETLRNTNFFPVRPKVGVQAVNASSLVIGSAATPGEAPGNLIGPADIAGIMLQNVTVAVIAGNAVRPGLASGGQSAEDPSGAGVCVVGSENVQIGTPTAGNLVSGHSVDGIDVTRSVSVAIEGNRVGTNGAGTAALGNENGIAVRGGRDLRIEGNLVSGNRADGISIALAERYGLTCAQTPNERGSYEMPGPVTIRGNTIGTDAAGASALANGGTGLSITGSLVTDPSGTGTPEFHVTDNLISGNRAGGARLDAQGRPFETQPTSTFMGNLVGTDRSGMRAIPNEGGNGAVVLGNSWLVGGVRTTTDCQSPCNVISGNVTPYGLELYGSAITVTGNVVGTARDGVTPLPNAGAGIRGRNDDYSPAPLIGGVQPGEWNTVAHNGRNGIEIEGTGGVTVRGNRLMANGGLGIDLAADGLTPNDSVLDSDDGPNHLLNFPRLDSVVLRDGMLRVSAFAPTPLDPLTSNVVDLYANGSCDPSGNGEGEFLLASASVGPLAEGFVGFEIPLDLRLGFTAVTATLTVAGSTSEFSRCVAITDENEATLRAAAPAGSTRLEVTSSTGLVGKVVALGSGQTSEKGYVDRSGSLILARPTRFAHAAGEPVTATDDTLYVSVDKAVVTRSSKWPDVAALNGRLRAIQGRSIACGEDVTLSLDGATVAQKLPGTKFTRQSGNRCVFVAKTTNGIGRLELDLGRRTWNAQVVRRDLERLTNPVEVGLTIGDDSGSESLRFSERGLVWKYSR